MENTRSLMSCIEDLSFEDIGNGEGILKVELKPGTTKDEAKAIKENLENIYKMISEITGTNDECETKILNSENFEILKE